jgi:L-aminopeptidase/D-esterase-like protein
MRGGAVQPTFGGPNTVLVVAATNAALQKAELHSITRMAVRGMERTIAPVFTKVDGDIVFALSAGDVEADVVALGAAAAEAVARAIVRGATQAEAAGGVPGLKGRV